MGGDVWVLAEQWRGRVSEITYEILALGRDLADEAGVRLEAVLVGRDVRGLADTLGTADSVLLIDHPLLAEPVASTYADVLGPVLAGRSPSVFLVPLTNISLGIGTLLAGELGLPALNFCRDAHFVDSRLRAHCVLYGGKIEAEVAPRGPTAILGIWPHARPPEKGHSQRLPAVEEIVASPDPAPAIRFRRYINPPAGDVDLTKQEVLVAVGRGIQGKENLALAEALARGIGGAVCASRSVVDQGWLPVSRQIGKSGLTVKPKLYFAMGISGAPEHVESIRKSDCIIAVNTDPQAPIFNAANYGVVGDALELMPALTRAVQARMHARTAGPGTQLQ